MSGSDDQPPVRCACPNKPCLQRYCNCFKAKVFCSENCTCRNCNNIERFRATVEQYQRGDAFLKRPIAPIMPTARGWCMCKKSKCSNGNCNCFKRNARCTSKCGCRDCANLEGIRGSDTNIEGEQVGDNSSSMAKEPAQMQEQPAQSVDNSGSGQYKRARNE